MKERAPAFQFYPRQFAGDDQVMGMDLEGVGAHILLMCAAAASPEGCRIDADEYAIRMRLRNPTDESWQRIKKQLLGGAWKVSDDGKWWIQQGLERTFNKQKEFSALQSERANVKWKSKDAGSMPNLSRKDAESIPDGMPKVCSSSSSSSSKQRGRLSHQMPDSFKPSDAHRALAAELRVNPDSAFAEFADHHVSKGSTFKDWDRAFNSWLRRECKFHRGQAGGATNRDNLSKRALTDNPATRALAQMGEAS
jgi:uncharacterized protein YdaU (DUF1376 family)